MTEHDEQTALFQWRDTMLPRCPELENMYAVPNGMFLMGGFKRRMGLIAKFKEEGMSPGVLDVCLAVRTAAFGALYIEMKYGRNTLSKEQKEWAARLKRWGNKVVVCRSWIEAANEVCHYLGVDLPVEG